jgi:hypothetical protein
LFPPPQASQRESETHRGRHYATSQTTLETNLALLEVAAHYEAQLSAVGGLGQRGHDGPLAWSTWNFNQSGQETQGVFAVLRIQANPQKYFLFIRVNTN